LREPKTITIIYLRVLQAPAFKPDFANFRLLRLSCLDQ